MLRFLFSPYGRISRKTFWLNWVVPYIAVSIVVVLLEYALLPINPETGEPAPVLQAVLGLAAFWPSIAVATKRLHDRGMTGWWNAVPFLAVALLSAAAYYYYSTRLAGAPPLAGEPNMAMVVGGILSFAVILWLVLYPTINILFLRGQSGANKYGDDPLGNSADTFK